MTDEKGQCIGVVSGPDFYFQEVTAENGRKWYFSFDRYMGPFWLKKNGEDRKCQTPCKAAWAAFDKWLEENNLKPKKETHEINREPEKQIQKSRRGRKLTCRAPLPRKLRNRPGGTDFRDDEGYPLRPI